MLLVTKAEATRRPVSPVLIARERMKARGPRTGERPEGLVKVEVIQRLELHDFVSATTSRGYEVASPRGHVASKFAKRRRHAERIASSQSNWRARRWWVVGDRQTALVHGVDVVTYGSGARAGEVTALEDLDHAVVYRLRDVAKSPLA